MRRDDAIRMLKLAEHELRARGVQSLALFGSTARDEARADSDVDILVELDMSRRPTLVDLSAMQFLLAAQLGHHADLAIRRNIKSGYRETIEADAIPVF